MGPGLVQRGFPSSLAQRASARPLTGRTRRRLDGPERFWPLTHSHAVHVALDDIKGVPQVPFGDVEDDVGMVGRIHGHDGPEKDDLCGRKAQHGAPGDAPSGPEKPGPRSPARRRRRGPEGSQVIAYPPFDHWGNGGLEKIWTFPEVLQLTAAAVVQRRK